MTDTNDADAATKLPLWLQRDETGRLGPESPLTERLATHLLGLSDRDPRVIELLQRLESNPQALHLARGIGGFAGSEGVIRKVHKDKNLSAENERDILRLAAYCSDNSYAHFFQDLIQLRDRDTSTMAPPEQQAHAAKLAEYTEEMQHIMPIVADIQPRVAIGFAGVIFATYRSVGQETALQEIYTDLAQKHPLQILFQHDRFENDAIGKEILSTAQRMNVVPINTVEAGLLTSIQLGDKIAGRFTDPTP